MKKTWIIGALIILLCAVGAGWYWYPLSDKALPKSYWKSYQKALVTFDQWGVPTIEGGDWGTIITTQGFLMASERLWQMDLLRRKAGGMLSEWFGEAAFEHDLANRSEDRIAIAKKAAKQLPEEEKLYCDSYANGINKFIKEQPQHWGLEYELMGSAPHPWSCSDTILILMEMADQLTATENSKLKANAWQKHLPSSWAQFLYPQNHRWNQPLFGEKSSEALELPAKVDWLKPYKLTGQAIKPVKIDPAFALGSNNWAYHSKKGSFLANDPHLRHSIPSIWYLIRMKRNKEDWVVGSSVPGIPGVILGMNPAFSWAFTNTGEDVDDLLAETINTDQTKYQDWDDQGQKIWRTLITKKFQIKVKGEDKPRTIQAKFTHRGPLKKDRYSGEGYYSRQWLALKPEVLRLPIKDLISMRTWDEVHKAIDNLSIPSQNILLMDRKGQMTYRNCGTGIFRALSVKTPKVQDAFDGEWLGFAPAYQRKRKTMSPSDKPSFLATANERIWVDEHHHHWSPDDRKARIREYLSQDKVLGYPEMEALQLDTTSKFRKQFVKWIAANIGKPSKKAQGLIKKFSKWDGSSRSDPLLFQQAKTAEDALEELLLRRIMDNFMPSEFNVPYQGRMKRAWKLELISRKNAFAAFGLNKREVAQFLATKMLEETRPHHEVNTWKAQHPFVKNVPLLGQYFAVKEHPQWGAFDTVNAEQAETGPSIRLIWNMEAPWRSSWIMAVGQSGHPGSKHYSSMQETWHKGKRIKVFADREAWF